MLTPAQIEERRSVLGGSDIGPVMGVHPYKSALDVALEKWDDSAKRPSGTWLRREE